MNTPRVPVVIVAGMQAGDRAIGMQNGLLWHVPEDMKRFKALTLGHPIIMGRKTFESILEILGKPLPGRTNIVITRDTSYKHEGVRVVHSLDEAIAIAESEHPKEIHIGGGSEIYHQVLPFVTRLHVTWFFDSKLGDTFFPAFEDDFVVAIEHPKQTRDGIEYQWVDYVRKD